jgi:hypothetical protein
MALLKDETNRVGRVCDLSHVVFAAQRSVGNKSDASPYEKNR